VQPNGRLREANQVTKLPDPISPLKSTFSLHESSLNTSTIHSITQKPLTPPDFFWKSEAQIQISEGGGPRSCPSAEEGSTATKSMEASRKHLRATAKVPEAQAVRTKQTSNE
jgi:hypothetical protein